MKDKYKIIGYYKGIILAKKLNNDRFYIINANTKTVFHYSSNEKEITEMFMMYLATYDYSEYKIGV